MNGLRSDSTKLVYRSGVRAFARVVNGDPDLDKSLEAYVTQVKKEERNPFGDLLTFAISLTEKDTPPKTANVYLTAVQSFFEHALDFELTKKQRKQLRNRMPRGKRARTVEEDLTRDRLRQILTHCDTKGKALFLFLESSGIRVGEALQLDFNDLNLESMPVKVNVRGEYTKSGDKYYSFISKEAKEALDEWLKVRGEYLRTSVRRGVGLSKTGHGRGLKSVKDGRIFPFSSSVPIHMWNNALRKAGLENHDKGTGRRTLHIHMLRKVFSSRMKLVVPQVIVEALMGHEGYLDDAYRRYTEAEIKEWYLKGEPHLYIFVPQELRKIQTQFNAELEEMTKKVNDLLYGNQKLIIQRDEQREQIKELTEDLGEVRAEFKHLVDFLIMKERHEAWRENRESYKDQLKWQAEMEKELPPIPKDELIRIREKLTEG